MNLTLPALIKAHLKHTTKRQSKRPRVLRSAKLNRRAEVAYRNQLLSLVKQMHQRVKEEILPILKEPEDGYTQDALSESLVQRIQAALERVSRAFLALIAHAHRWAQRMVKQVDEDNRTALIGSIRYAFGIDIAPLLNVPTLNAPLQLAMATNVHLIRSISQRYFEQLRTSVLTGVLEGRRYTELAKDIKKLTGATEKRARLIARDQTAKTHAAIAQARQTALGITEYEWQTSGDERVRDSHADNDGKRFKWETPPESGHPGHDIACRCVALPIIDLT
ncbi:Phage Mu protein [Mycoavidus cysteinexigens]|uniref:Phage Mu protein n=2 Tax=Mycoavidus cysteinexigens TaxID=1553431 RepID=A0A2Z6ET57_9BURK|nr:phage minor head protein [Mycoavidus cysteinexigens]BBE08589.1 Phage Mu protein [Mycoavidus cysteinexigens]